MLLDEDLSVQDLILTEIQLRRGVDDCLQGKYAEAEPLYVRCQAICEKALGPEDPRVATTLNNRAGLLRMQVGAVRIFLSVLHHCCSAQQSGGIVGESGESHRIFHGNFVGLACAGKFSVPLGSSPHNSTFPARRPNILKRSLFTSGHRPPERRCWVRSILPSLCSTTGRGC